MKISIIEKGLSRWSIHFFIGILIKFLIDVTYSLIYRNYPLFQPIEDYLFAGIASMITLELIFYFRKWLNKKVSWEENPTKRFFSQLIISVIIGILFIGLGLWGYRTALSQINYIRLLDEIIVVIFIFLTTSIIVISELSIFLLNKWRFSLAELERFKKENAEFQFEALRSQVNPHFLFNSLNTLSSLIYENKEKAESFIRELSDVYRYILENRGKEIVSLQNEIKIAKSYLYLMQLRFDENLSVSLTVPEKYQKFFIAPLTLQLLVENAIKHNIISRKKPLEITIFIDNEHLLIKNNLQKKETKEFSSQLGLKNIISRYAFLTDKKVEIFETETEFKVSIPLINKS